MSQSPLNLVPTFALEQQYFAKNGLAVTLTALDSGSNTVTALVANECDAAFVAGSAVANAVAAGHDLVVIAGLVNRQLYSLVVNPRIRDAQDLVGTTVVTGRAGGAADLVMRSMLRSLGLDPDKDVTLYAIGGGQSERLAAMQTGDVAATVISVPEASRAVQFGYHILLSPADLDAPYQHTVIATVRPRLKETRPALKAFLQAIIQSIATLKQDRESAIASMAALLQMDPAQDAAFLDDAYEQLILKYLESVPYPSVAGVQSLLAEVARENEAARSMDASALIDIGLLKEMEDEGLLKFLSNQ